MSQVLITGASKGLGLEFVTQYLARGDHVIATARDLENASKLHALNKKYLDKLKLFSLDVSKDQSRKEFFLSVSKKCKAIDIFINNAGIRSGGDKDSYTLGEMYSEDIEQVFRVNSIAPVLLSELFIDLIEKGKNPRIINITSGLASLSKKTFVFRYSYCASKTALNMFSKLMALELKEKNIIVIPLHPGHVRTDLGGIGAPLSPQESIQGMIKVIDSLSMDDTGRYLDWQRNELPW
ncbi:SDR family oxidoreductase [Candidatus Hodarchaeum mangrovi]